jgi:hypothetical protein
MAEASNLVRSVQELSRLVSSDSFENDAGSRREALKLTKELANELEDPAYKAAELAFLVSQAQPLKKYDSH